MLFSSATDWRNSQFSSATNWRDSQFFFCLWSINEIHIFFFVTNWDSHFYSTRDGLCSWFYSASDWWNLQFYFTTNWLNSQFLFCDRLTKFAVFILWPTDKIHNFIWQAIRKNSQTFPWSWNPWSIKEILIRYMQYWFLSQQNIS